MRSIISTYPAERNQFEMPLLRPFADAIFMELNFMLNYFHAQLKVSIIIDI